MLSVFGMINPRYHCGDEMDYIGENKQGHGFACKQCEYLEYANDPEALTAPEEKPRKHPLSYGYETKIGQ